MTAASYLHQIVLLLEACVGSQVALPLQAALGRAKVLVIHQLQPHLQHEARQYATRQVAAHTALLTN